MSTGRNHTPVLYHESLSALAPKPGEYVIDCTAGAGGHMLGFTERVLPRGMVVGIDQDSRAFEPDAAFGVVQKYPEHARLVRGNFGDLVSLKEQLPFAHADIIFADIGVSSMQFDESERGFSFRSDAPLDMRMDPDAAMTAYDILAETDEQSLANLIYQYGEEHASRQIAHAIKKKWPIPDSTRHLSQLIEDTIPRRGKIHPATKTFQALRIAVNRELEVLERFLEAAPSLLKPGGRLGVITFHSLEDRLVKQAFQRLTRRVARQKYASTQTLMESDSPEVKFRKYSKKPIVPSGDEVRQNPRARSAKLRIIIREDGDDWEKPVWA